MDLNAVIERLVDERVRELLAQHVCSCVREQLRVDVALREVTADVWLSTSDAAAYTGRHPATIRAHAAAETLRSTQAGRGRGRRYRREWLDEWLEEPSRRRTGQ